VCEQDHGQRLAVDVMARREIKISAMTPTGRILIIEMTAFISLGCLVVAAGVQGKANRLAMETPDTAMVAKVWSERPPKVEDRSIARS
jgi:hypothetical protein